MTKSLIVFDSFFGNTEQIARAIASGMGDAEQVKLLRVGEATADVWAGASLLLVGSPTRAFKPTPAMSKFLKGIPRNGLKGVKVAAFDTRFPQDVIDDSGALLHNLVKVFGYAAEPLGKLLVKAGGEQVVPPEGFFVLGTEGPLKEGELARAEAWGKAIRARL
jgi:flavodoxin